MIDPVGQSLLRFAVFFGLLIALAIFELVQPRRRVTADKTSRWLTNLTMASLSLILLRLMAALSVPLAAIAAAAYAQSRGIGLFNALDWPAALETGVAIVALDFAVWLQHVLSHKVPLLWRLHQVHHADRDIDVTTGIRFHPIEIGLSMVWKIVCVMILGASPLAVLLFEVVLNAGALFSHANIALPQAVDSRLRRVIVTPDMHRVHHSVDFDELSSNFGFNLSVWDRVFGTYRSQPKKGHENMTIGLLAHQSSEPQHLVWSLGLPFRKTAD